jgi:hypothetical protein
VSAPTFTGPLLVGAALLFTGGVAKLVRPDNMARALRATNLRLGVGGIRVAAFAEVVVAAAAVVAGGWLPAALVALSYAAFAGFVATALARGWALSSCGCFGTPDSPPTAVHVVVDLVLAAGAAAAAVRGGTAPVTLISGRPGWGAAMVSASVVTTGLAYLVLVRLPRLRAELS